MYAAATSPPRVPAPRPSRRSLARKSMWARMAVPLTASATRREAAEAASLGAEAHASCNRTCELGLTRATGKPYRHVLELLAEQAGLIGQFGRWVMRTACFQMVEWQRQGIAPLRMRVPDGADDGRLLVMPEQSARRVHEDECQRRILEHGLHHRQETHRIVRSKNRRHR